MNRFNLRVKTLLMQWAGVSVHLIVVICGHQAAFAQGLIDDVRQAIPIGALVPFAGTSVDEEKGHWMLCDGRKLEIPKGPGDQYWELYKVLGTTYGNAKEFRLPDLRGRIPLGRDDMGGVKAGRITGGSKTKGHEIEGTTLGDSGGSETHQITENELPEHKHAYEQSVAKTTDKRLGTSEDNIARGETIGLWAQKAFTTTIPTNEPAARHLKGHARNNLQPSIILNYIIRYRSSR